MTRSRTSFAKLERERAKQAKAREKSERRAARETEAAEAGPVGETLDHATVMARLQKLQEALAAGEIDAVEFEARRDELAQLLDV